MIRSSGYADVFRSFPQAKIESSIALSVWVLIQHFDGRTIHYKCLTRTAQEICSKWSVWDIT